MSIDSIMDQDIAWDLHLIAWIIQMFLTNAHGSILTSSTQISCVCYFEHTPSFHVYLSVASHSLVSPYDIFYSVPPHSTTVIHEVTYGVILKSSMIANDTYMPLNI